MTDSGEIFPRPVTQNPPLDGPVLMRDGRSAYLRVAKESDLPALVALLQRTSNASLSFRFFGPSRRDEELARLLINTKGTYRGESRFKGISLVVGIGDPGHETLIAVASAVPVSPTQAEIAFLVEDRFHGKGLGTLLLERLGFAAETHGVDRLSAMVVAENRAMLGVFRDCGYRQVQEYDHGEVHFEFEIEPSETSNRRAEMRDKMATQASLRPFFRPRSVAVVGASRKTTSVGGRVFAQVLGEGFEGPVYPVNARARKVQGRPAWRRVTDLPGPVDLALIAVPASEMSKVIDDCAAFNVAGVVVLSSGFAEGGTEGQDLQTDLLRRVRRKGMRLIGPNCLGLLNTSRGVKLNAVISAGPVDRGSMAMCSQGGGMGLAVLNGSRDYRVGISSFVNVGNKADVSGNDLLQYWEDDDETGLILLYLESFGNPRRFARIAPRVARKKPILAVGGTLSGIEQATSKASSGAVPEEGSPAEVLFRQAGIIHADSLEEVFEVAELLAHQPLPRGNRVAVISNAADLAAYCAGVCRSSGLQLGALSSNSERKLDRLLPNRRDGGNPLSLDPGEAASRIEKALAIVLEDPGVDAAILVHVSSEDVPAEKVAAALHRKQGTAGKRQEKPIVMAIPAQPPAQPFSVERYRTIPVYRFPESAVRALARAAEYSRWLARPRGIIPVQERLDTDHFLEVAENVARERGAGWVPAEDVEQMLQILGIRLWPTRACRDADEAIAEANARGYPVALKLASPSGGAVAFRSTFRLDLRSDEEVTTAFRFLQSQRSDSESDVSRIAVLIQPMAPPAPEVLIRVAHDPVFGPLITLGTAGVDAEALGDRVTRLTPITDQDALEMVHELKGCELLKGYRGAPHADIDSLVDLLLRVSRLVEEAPQIEEVELNPVRAYPPGEGAVVLKASLRMGAPEPS